MHGLFYSLASVATALLGLLCGGALGTVCVRWYRISSFEGGSGYFVVAVALAGAVAGFVVGLVTVIAMAPRETMDYAKALGIASGSVIALTGAIAFGSWLRADLPPTLDGHTLTLEVELRLPTGAERPVDNGAGSYVTLQSLADRQVRASSRANLELHLARFDEGRWIVPGRVPLFTRRGQRGLEFQLNGESVAVFMTSIPARPGRELLAWSEWLPRPPAPRPPWPDDRPSFRYRLRPDLPLPPASTDTPEPADVRDADQASFEAMPEDAPVEAWLAFAGDGSHEGRRRAALDRMVMRQDWVEQLGALMCSEDSVTAALALRVVRQLPVQPQSLVPQVASAGRAIAARARAGAAISADADPGYAWAADVSVRFSSWFDAASALRETCGADFTAQLSEILDAARARPDSDALRMDVVRVASYHLQAWAGIPPLDSDPPPR